MFCFQPIPTSVRVNLTIARQLETMVCQPQHFQHPATVSAHCQI
jgi:hypothetical protein